jgi:hypothetical protein
MAESNLPLTRDDVLLSIDEVTSEQMSPAETLSETATDAKTMRPREKRPKDNNKTELRLKALEKEIKELTTLLKLAGVYQLKTSFTQQPAKTNTRSRRSKAQQRE